MTSDPVPIDISHMPDLLRLAEEVRATGEPRLLCRDGEEVAMLVPASHSPERRPRKPLDEADLEAFRAAAGGWNGIVDTEQLKKDIRAARGSDRPPTTL